MSVLYNLLSGYPHLQKIYKNACTTYDLYTLFLPHRLRYLWSQITTANPKTALFYPQRPNASYTIYKICSVNGYKITNKPQHADVVMYFQDSTHRTPDAMLQSLHRTQYVINYHSQDISKKKVDEIHKKVFGYSLSIDPQTYRGSYVKKSDDNSLDDHKILDTPEKPQEGYVYQRIVQNERKDEVVDIRLFVFGKSIPISCVKYRSAESRFDRKNRLVKNIETEKVISKDEYKKILQFCHHMGIDYGELDALRDNKTKKLYIVDANNTPGGPPIALPKKEQMRAIYCMAAAFEKAFISSKKNDNH